MPTSIISVSDLDLDNSIQQDTTTTSDYFADNGIIRADFIQSGNTVKYTSKGRMITWVPQNMRYIDSLGMEDTIYSAQDVPLETKANYVRFNRTMPDIDDWFIVDNDQVKHQILVQGFQRDPMPYLSDPIQFAVGGQLMFDADLTVRSMGMTLTDAFQTADAIQLCNGDDVVFTLPQVVAYDSRIPERAQTTGFYNVTTNEAGNLQFDIVIDNAWVSDAARVYPLVIDPTVVVASAYDTSGSGARKEVKLPGGRQINIAVNTSSTTIYAFKSDDSGTTWSQLCTISGAQAGAAICNVGNNCTVLFNSTTTVYSVTFDGTTVTNIDLNSTKVTIDTQTSISNNVSIISDGTGKLWPVWCSKNATYPNMNNLRVSTSMDGITWAAPTQVTVLNTAGGYSGWTNPCIAIRSNNLPTITAQTYINAGAYGIGFEYFNGTTWTVGVLGVYNASAHIQSNPCDAVDGNDVIFCVWDGTDTTTTNSRARWNKSTDGGATWSAMALINPGSTNASTKVSLDVRPDGSLDAFWQEIDTAISATYTQIRRANLPAGSSTWSAPVTVTNNTTANATNPQTLWSKFNDNSTDAVRYMWMNGSAVNYDSIIINSPPNAPILTTKSNFDATQAATFTATFSDPDSWDTMSARQMQIIDTSNGSTAWDSTKVAQTTTTGNKTFTVQLPANTLANGKQYQWKETTWDAVGVQGPWSALSTFSTAAPSIVTITSPTANQVVGQSSVTLNWSVSDPGNFPQSTYDAQLYDQTGAGTPLWDSGTVQDANARTRTVGYTLPNNTAYVAKVTVTNSQGVASIVAAQSFSVSYTPPATAILEVTPNQAGAYNSLAITNPVPSGSQPTVSSNDLYRKQTGSSDTPMRIATGIANNGIYKDYTVPSGVSHDYYVLSSGSNGTSSQSATASQTVTLAGVWIHDPLDPPGTIYNFRLREQNRTAQTNYGQTMMHFEGRPLPIADISGQSDEQVQVTINCLASNGDLDTLRSLIARQTTLLYRDARGRKVYGVVSAVPETEQSWGTQVQLTVNAVDYQEGV